MKRKKIKVGTWFYASFVDWIVRCGRCTQQMEADEHELTEAGVKWTKCLDNPAYMIREKVSFSPFLMKNDIRMDELFIMRSITFRK